MKNYKNTLFGGFCYTYTFSCVAHLEELNLYLVQKYFMLRVVVYSYGSTRRATTLMLLNNIQQRQLSTLRAEKEKKM